jgi:proteasome lid subunit RPN8/RPN11
VTPVRIAADAAAAVIHACRSAHPIEVCGFLGARDGVLAEAHPVPNVADAAPDRCGFRMDPTAQLRAMRAIEDAGLDLGAIYHSHPHSAPVPSEPDVRLAAYPELAYLIVGLRDPESPDLCAWRIVDGTTHALTVHIVDASAHPAEAR